MTNDQIQAEAELLDRAERERHQVRQTTSVYPDATIEDAYKIQRAWREIRVDRGEQIVGHKIGLTSRAMQQAMKIATPDSGFITNVMSFDGDTEMDAGDYLDPKLEVELAFVLRRSIDADVVAEIDAVVAAKGPQAGIDIVLDATEYVVPALELIAARSYRRDPDSGRARTVVDTIADNAANGAIITGASRIDVRSPRPRTDLRWSGAILRRNDVVEETGLAAAVLDHPANGIIWLARRYGEHAMSIDAGQTILAGSFTRPVDVRAGDHFVADFGELGSFEVRFTGGSA